MRRETFDLAVRRLRARRGCRGHPAQRTRGRGSQRGDELEPDRDDHARPVPWAGGRSAACAPDQHGDGAGRGVRRGQRDRADARAVPLQTTFPSTASKQAAVATAAYTVLSDIVAAVPDAVSFPNRPSLTSLQLHLQYAASLAAIPNGQSKTDGIAAGNAAANAMIAARQGDGRFGPSQWDQSTGAGLAAAVAERDVAARPDTVGRARRAVPDAELLAVPQRRPERAHQQPIREGLQRGQGARPGGQHGPHTRADAQRRVLAERGRPDSPVERRRPRPGRGPRLRCRSR